MKIQSISNIYNSFKINRLKATQFSNVSNNPFLHKGLTGDVISFKAKAYNALSIENPTNHCAYCGCKVYNESQIESLAKEMMRDSSHRLQGDIKSVLEKLENAERSYELTVAKQMENKKEIEFYRKFLEQSEDKSWLKGEAIFQQIYDMEPEEAFEALKKNLRPLSKTIDHVSPQNLGEENKDEDINLVEACYCCNHDLKKGMPFSEFYTMYPSIKENMPIEKFKYAHSQLIASSSSGILSRVSASSLIKYVSGLFEQRNRVITQLDNVDFRIAESETSVTSRINSCREEISQKEAEIVELKDKLAQISDNDEYIAMLERLKLFKQQDEIEIELSLLKAKRKNVSESLNEINHPPKKQKKQKVNISKELIEQKKAALMLSLTELKSSIEEKEIELQINASEREQLDEMHPTIEILQARKNSYDLIINAYCQFSVEKTQNDELRAKSEQQLAEIARLDSEIDSCKQETFDITTYSSAEQEKYNEYTTLVEAMRYIEQHSKGNGIKSIVNRSAKGQIQQAIDELLKLPVVIAANEFNRIKELISQRQKLKEEQETIHKNILVSQNKLSQLQKVIEKCSIDEARQQSQEISVRIRNLNDIQNYLKIPQTIEILEAEILMLNSAIADLEKKQKEIVELRMQQH